MKRQRTIIQHAIVGLGLAVVLFNGATARAGDSGNAGTTQRFRGTEQGDRAVPQVTAKQAAPGTSLRFAAKSPASEASNDGAAPAGSTMRFASPIAGEADQSVRHGMVDVKEEGGRKGTFN